MRGREGRTLRSIGGATSVTTRLAGAVVGVSLVSLLVATLVGLTAGRDLGRDLYEERLVAMRSSASFDASAYVRSLARNAESLASSPQAAAAIDAFTEGHAELLSSAQLSDEQENDLVAAYQRRYVEPWREAGRDIRLRDVAAENLAGLTLQYEYAVDLGNLAAPEAVVDADDGSAWTETHAVVHPVYRDVVSRTGIVDLLLVEPDNGYVVYSVRKRPDLGTSLDAGPYSGSILAEATAALRSDPSQGVVTTDLSFYTPALTTPVGVVAAPVLDGSRFAGVLVLMYDSDRLTELLTADGDWDEGGFPETGETFLVGADGTVRTEPRSFIEDPAAHLDAVEAAGNLTAEERAIIEASGTTVLTQRAGRATVAAGSDGEQDVEKRPTMTGVDGVSTVVPVDAQDLEWWTVAEMEAAAAEGDLGDFQEFLVVGSAIFLVVLSFLAVAWANGIVRPVRDISDRLGSERRDDLGPLELSPRSPVEFQQLAGSFRSMAQRLEDHRAGLAAASDARFALLRRLLPPNVADRVAAGEVRTLEDVPEASAVVAVAHGPTGGDPSDRDLVDRFHVELDDLADRHGLERVKVVGDAYYAACGHDRPYLDHAARAAAFAADAHDAMRAMSPASEWSVAVGMDTGAVTVGMTGENRMVYDVWGPAVSGAHQLARRAAAGATLSSDRTRRRLPDTIAATPQDDSEEPVWALGPQVAERRP